MARSAFLLLISTLFFISCSSTGGSDKHSYKLQLEEGDEMLGRLEARLHADVSLLGDIKLDAVIVSDLKNVVRSSNAQQTEVDLSVEDLSVDFEFQQNIIVNDDIKGQQSVDLSDLEEQYRGQQLTIVYDPQSRIEEIKGLDDILGDGASDSIRSSLMDLESLMGDNFLERLESFFAVLPDEPVAIGDKWGHSIEQEIIGIPLTLNSEFQFDSRDSINGQTYAKFLIDGKFTMDTVDLGSDFVPFEAMREAPINPKELKVIIKRANQSGYVLVNEETGWTHSSQIEQDLRLEIQYSIVNIPLDVKNSITLSPRQ
jgi:hypothetical protein